MKSLKIVIMGAALMVLAPVSSWALNGGEGLKATPHDFTSTHDGDPAAATAGVGLCTFCHTPHRAITTQLLWNHTLSVNNFSWDIPATTAGTTFATFKGDTYKGASAKCLSCHDGTVAIGDVNWFMEASPTGASALNMMKHNTPGDEMQIATATGSMAGNHPVAMPFPFNNTANTYNGVTNGANLQTGEWQSDPWNAGAGTNGTKVRLFNDDGAGNITAGPVATKTGIECSSCHDPHNKASVDDLFLRGKMTGSDAASGYLCLQCHNK
jgi:hypothetical protein